MMPGNFLPQPPSRPKSTGGKRAPSCPLAMSISSSESDEEENNVSMEKTPSPRISLDLGNLKSSPRSNVQKSENDHDSPSPCSDSSRNPSAVSNYATEHDHDYENIASPCSSTASGPTYVRPPGFEHHAQEIVSNSKIKKKKTALFPSRENLRKREQTVTPPKVKPKREPLPMKLRALPQSFWQQPNIPHQVSPGSIFPILPPLSIKDTGEDVTEVRPVTPPTDQESKKTSRLPDQKVSVADTALLFRLFDSVNQNKKPNPKSHKRPRMKTPRTVVRCKSNMKGLLSGNDPYLVEDVTDKLFPQLSLEHGRNGVGGGMTTLQVITVPNGDKTLTLPTLSIEQNYPQILSELVMHI
ncbi:hypothetical protein SNE40_015740 [Patella caerulea]|uniref:Uncharacterized protein n=2 Tax=Patella caerulea TaxID=87958 RepID=A0AAN8PFE3_PATCE